MRALVSTVFGLFAITASASPFIYDIEGIPADNPTTSECRQVARDIASQWQASDAIFANAIGVCVRMNNTSYDIQIRYEAEYGVVPVSTTNAGSSLVSPGFYPNRASCEAALPGEIAAFEENTGLTPLYTPYCYSEDPRFNELPWMFRIEAVGQPAAAPQLEMAVLQGEPANQSRESVMATMKRRLEEMWWVDVREMRYSSEIDLAFVNVFLYSEANIGFETGTYGEMDSVETCETELERLKLAAANTQHLVLYCGRQLFRGPQLVGLFLDFVPFRTLTSVDHFSSYSACVRGRTDVIDQYVADGLAITDGLCQVDEDGLWRVNLLSPYTPLP